MMILPLGQQLASNITGVRKTFTSPFAIPAPLRLRGKKRELFNPQKTLTVPVSCPIIKL